MAVVGPLHRNQLEWSPNRPACIQAGKAGRAGRTLLPDSGDRRRDLLELSGLNFQPRYARVAQSLIEDIAAGKFPVGSLIATEADLCERFGVSRNTARAALAVLSDMGLVTRHAGIGTFVRSLTADARYVQEAEIGFRAVSEYRSD